MKAGETLFCGVGNVLALQDPLIGSLRGVVCLAGAYAGGGFLLEFQRGTEVIVERAPRVGVQIVHQVDQLGILEAGVAEELADVAPVCLFDVGIVVFLVGA